MAPYPNHNPNPNCNGTLNLTQTLTPNPNPNPNRKHNRTLNLTLTLTLTLIHAALLFLMLWGGLDIRADRTIQLRDEELASLRPAWWFVQVLEHDIPKTPTEIEQHLRYYSLTDSPLPLTEFDRLLFTGVYCAYQICSMQGLDKNLWISFFSQLVDEIFRDLCKGCISPFPVFFCCCLVVWLFFLSGLC
uniref:F180B protein n=1 Tax=Buteo japonicus TaxID=224669 RepID=A0A8C0BG33_9AVES